MYACACVHGRLLMACLCTYSNLHSRVQTRILVVIGAAGAHFLDCAVQREKQLLPNHLQSRISLSLPLPPSVCLSVCLTVCLSD